MLVFNDGLEWLAENGWPTVIELALSVLAESEFNPDTDADTIGEVAGTGYLRMSSVRTVAAAKQISFAGVSWNTYDAFDWPKAVRSVVALSRTEPAHPLVAWNLDAPRDMSKPLTSEEVHASVLL